MKQLRWFDVLALTAILWGQSIYLSVISYLELLGGANPYDEAYSFSAADAYHSLFVQAVLLCIAFVYLYIRRFDFSVWVIRLTPVALAKGVFLFACAALMYDLYWYLTTPLSSLLPIPHPLGALFRNTTFASVVYALLNGPYEELFFLGICTSLKEKYRGLSLAFSLCIRFLIHLYLGTITAIGIGFLFGALMYTVFWKSSDKNLVPFFVAHVLADIFGLGLISYL